jgi:hypothetical protein
MRQAIGPKNTASKKKPRLPRSVLQECLAGVSEECLTGAARKVSQKNIVFPAVYRKSVQPNCPTRVSNENVSRKYLLSGWRSLSPARKLFSVPTCTYLDDVTCLNHVVYFHLVFSIQLCGFYQSIFSMPFS